VHIAAGLSALAAALIVGRRRGCVYWKDQLKALDQKGSNKADHMGSEFKPTNIPYVILGQAYFGSDGSVSTVVVHWQLIALLYPPW